MAAYSQRESIIRRIEVFLAVPTVGAELSKAYAAALGYYREAHDIEPGTATPYDALTVTVTDDAVVISFEVAE